MFKLLAISRTNASYPILYNEISDYENRQARFGLTTKNVNFHCAARIHPLSKCVLPCCCNIQFVTYSFVYLFNIQKNYKSLDNYDTLDEGKYDNDDKVAQCLEYLLKNI